MISKHIIEKAIAGGWKWFLGDRTSTEQLNLVINDYEAPAWQEIALDPDFWMALDKEMGWGKWSIPFEKFEHKWELDHYLADTAKTPVYFCECGARKINELVQWKDYEGSEYENKPTRDWHMVKHGSKYLNVWERQARDFYDLILRKASQEEIANFWEGLSPNAEK